MATGYINSPYEKIKFRPRTDVKPPEKICVLDDLPAIIVEKLKLQHCKYIVADTQLALRINEKESNILFIVKDFEGELFNAITETKRNRIFGPTAILELVTNDLPVLPKKNNVYSLSMDGLVFYISLRDTELAVKLATLIRFMGGSIRANYTDVTHFITGTTLSNAYKYAIVFMIPVMTPEWVEAVWGKRNVVGFKADCAEMVKYYKIKPFMGLSISLIGFSDHERTHLLYILEKNHGKLVDTNGDAHSTHVVVQTDMATEMKTNSQDINSFVPGSFLVDANWFWACVTTGDKVDEKGYLIKQNNRSYYNKSAEENATGNRIELIKNEIGSINKSNLNHSSKVTDCCGYTDHPCIDEFLETEYRYRRVLEVIIQISDEGVGGNGKLINQTEEKMIFGNIRSIYEIHGKILRELQAANETNRIRTLADVIIKYKNELLHHYPTYSNGFEESQRMLKQCIESKPEFHKLLEKWGKSSESGRQHLRELMIRPIQRLGSITLLLKEIKKNIPEGSSQSQNVENALMSLQDVLSLMNGNKERVDCVCTLFEVYNSIVNCPADLITSTRKLVMKFYARELTGNVASRGETLLIFVFSDVIEISYIRKRVKALFLSGAEEEILFKVSEGKPYKHITTFQIADIRRIIDFCDEGDITNSFALVCRKETEVRETIVCFKYKHGEITKANLLQMLVTCIAHYNDSTNNSEFFTQLYPHEVDVKFPSAKRNLIDTLKSMH